MHPRWRCGAAAPLRAGPCPEPPCCPPAPGPAATSSRRGCCAALCCAVLCCAVLCCAVLGRWGAAPGAAAGVSAGGLAGGRARPPACASLACTATCHAVALRLGTAHPPSQSIEVGTLPAPCAPAPACRSPPCRPPPGPAAPAPGASCTAPLQHQRQRIEPALPPAGRLPARLQAPPLQPWRHVHTPTAPTHGQPQVDCLLRRLLQINERLEDTSARPLPRSCSRACRAARGAACRGPRAAGSLLHSSRARRSWRAAAAAAPPARPPAHERPVISPGQCPYRGLGGAEDGSPAVSPAQAAAGRGAGCSGGVGGQACSGGPATSLQPHS